MQARGGKATYGEAIGVLVLDTLFPRIPGDIGNATTFDFPVKYRVVSGATDDRVVLQKNVDEALLNDFVQAAQALEREGVQAIVTTCGFLSVFQQELADAVSVPVVSSSLLLVPLVQRMLRKDQKIGIVTANSKTLTQKHLQAAGIDAEASIAIAGIESGEEFSRVILQDKASQDTAMDTQKVESEVVAVCNTLLAQEPDIGALVFECTNLQPYAAAVQQQTALPVFGIYHAVNLLHGAIVPRRFTGHL